MAAICLGLNVLTNFIIFVILKNIYMEENCIYPL